MVNYGLDEVSGIEANLIIRDEELGISPDQGGIWVPSPGLVDRPAYRFRLHETYENGIELWLNRVRAADPPVFLATADYSDQEQFVVGYWTESSSWVLGEDLRTVVDSRWRWGRPDVALIDWLGKIRELD